jgi:hypothetical protein
MKKIYNLTITYLFLSLLVNAQSTYYKMLKEDTTTWQHYGFVPGVSPNSLSSAQGPQIGVSSYASLDTISFNGLKYVKFYLLNYFYNSIYYSNKSLVGYLREDTLARKVYYKANASASDMLLYDFSQNVSDSSYWVFPNNSSLSGYYRVDSIVVKNEVAGPRKRFYYRKHANNPNPSFYYFENIESVGSTYHIAYLFTGNMYNLWTSSSPSFQPPVTCFYNWDVGLTCKHNDQVQQFQSCTSTYSVWGWHPDACTYFISGGGLKTNDWGSLVKIGPNPGSEQIEISIGENFEEITCSVTDMTGNVILNFPKSVMNTAKNSFIFSSRDLAPGVYIIQVTLNGTLIKRPVVIQH